MNSEPNPYAPPAVAEPEAASDRYWQIDGSTVIARNGATLPRIDLETGSSADPMRAVRHMRATSGPLALLRMLLMIGICVVLGLHFDTSFTTNFIILFIGTLVLQRLGVFSAHRDSRIIVWTFAEETRAKRAALRRGIRVAVILLVALLQLTLAIISPIGWFFGGVLAGIALLLATAIWAMNDRSMLLLGAGPPGWLRISRVHPQAIAALRETEERSLPDNPIPGTFPARRIRSVFLYKFPLALLLHKRWANPWLVLNVVLMKLFRSRLLVRDAWHHSEASPRPLGSLSPGLQNPCHDWLRSHPGWSFLRGEHLPSPAGDLIVETAVLASPDLEHTALLTRAWTEQRPDDALLQLRFVSWPAGSPPLNTHDHPFLCLQHPHLHHRATGTPDDVFRQHLRHLSGIALHRPQDPADLLQLLDADRETTDLLLTRAGLQSDSREA